MRSYRVHVTVDLDRIAYQEHRLRLPAFDETIAWKLGSRLRELAEERGEAVTVEVRLGGATVFFAAMHGTTPANADWARRKRNLVELLHVSSYRLGLEAKRDGRSAIEQMGLDPKHHANHGGAFPVVVDSVGVVGVITVSGLPQRADHELVVEVLAEHLDIDRLDVQLHTETT
jgi:uncharacterized protein (UPF0303 family)